MSYSDSEDEQCPRKRMLVHVEDPPNPLGFAILPRADNIDQVTENGNTFYVEAILEKRILPPNFVEFRVAWTNWTLNCQGQEQWLSRWNFEQRDIIDFFEDRCLKELNLVKGFLRYISKADFDAFFVTFKDRFLYKGLGQPTTEMMVNRLYIRRRESKWNDALAMTGEARIYVMNWTDIPAEFSFKMVHNTVVSEKLKMEMQLLAHDDLDDQIGEYCKCVGKCNAYCPCGQTQGGGIVMRGSKVKLDTVKPGSHFVACGPKCSCSDDCPRKFTQRGRKHAMILFYLGQTKGWGLLAGEKIPKGSFMGHYFGELKRGGYGKGDDLTYQFSLVDDNALGHFVIDARHYGNECRFFNNSCTPNMIPFNIYHSYNKSMNLVGFITTEDVQLGTELTFRYTSNGGRGVKCMCHPGCTTRL